MVHRITLRLLVPAALALLVGALAVPAWALPPAHPALARWAEAWEAADSAALAELYAEDARVMLTDTRVQQAADEALEAALDEEAGEVASRRLEFGRHHWTDLGGTALSSGSATATFHTADGQMLQYTMRFSILWRPVGKGWAIVDQHLSLLPFDDE